MRMTAAEKARRAVQRARARHAARNSDVLAAQQETPINVVKWDRAVRRRTSAQKSIDRAIAKWEIALEEDQVTVGAFVKLCGAHEGEGLHLTRVFT